MMYIIPGEPTAWASHNRNGKRNFSPHYEAKKTAQWNLKIQHGDLPLITNAIRVDFLFEMPIPKSMPKKLQKLVDAGVKVYHTRRKDRSNCLKFAEDCLTGIVIYDDNIICCGKTEKYYSRTPQTIIYITEINNVQRDDT